MGIAFFFLMISKRESVYSLSDCPILLSISEMITYVSSASQSLRRDAFYRPSDRRRHTHMRTQTRAKRDLVILLG